MPAAHHSDVAFALRDLVPFVEDADFDRSMGRLARSAALVSVAELAEDDDVTAYADAAWQAGLDPADFPRTDPESGDGPVDFAAFRSAVIEHWDLQLLTLVDQLIAQNDLLDPAAVPAAGWASQKQKPLVRSAGAARSANTRK